MKNPVPVSRIREVRDQHPVGTLGVAFVIGVALGVAKTLLEPRMPRFAPRRPVGRRAQQWLSSMGRRFT